MSNYRRDAHNQLRYGRFVLTTAKDNASRRRASRYRSASYTPESSADHAPGGLSTTALTLPRMRREDSGLDDAKGEEPERQCERVTCRGRRGCICPRTRCSTCGDDCGRRIDALSSELCKRCERRLEAPQEPSLRSFYDLSVLDVTADEYASLSSWSIYAATNVLQLEHQKRQLRRAEVSERWRWRDAACPPSVGCDLTSAASTARMLRFTHTPTRHQFIHAELLRIEGQQLPASPELARAVVQDKRRARAVLEALSLSFTTTRAPVVLADGMFGENAVDVLGGAFTAHGAADGSMSYSESSDLMVRRQTVFTHSVVPTLRGSNNSLKPF